MNIILFFYHLKSRSKSACIKLTCSVDVIPMSMNFESLTAKFGYGYNAISWCKSSDSK